MVKSSFQAELLEKIPREPDAYITMTDMVKRIHKHWGKSTSIESKRRKLSNNLKKLEEIFPNSLDKRKLPGNDKEYYFRFKSNSSIMPAMMSQEQMIAFGLLSKFGTDLLSDRTHRALSPFFEKAKESAAGVARDAGYGVRASKNLGRHWLEKIAVVPAVLPFCPPKIDETIKQIVHQALILEKKLHLKIVHSPSNDIEDCEVSPLALVQQGVRTYLIGKKKGKRTADRFLLKRILEAKQLKGDLEVPDNWNLDTFLKQGIGHPVFPVEIYGKLENIELKIDADSQWLKETPLAENPIIDNCEDGGYIMKVEMPITEELVHWLLSMAFHVKVIKPDYLMARLKDDLKKSAAMYK
ncbi:YafY family protein [Limnohabitans sp. 2KL-3]|uniref:helix-turn-helix transcriptional regulator n=1 Tax=Limnohabitans sp. 2KL-3 TaxID=1100700 RepID=UPI000ACF0F36|nr:WYL domain-containing protein [Limnohabitans sp. 2KL-3]